MINRMLTYLSTLSCLEGRRITVDRLASPPYSLSLSGGGTGKVHKQYADGERIMRHTFTLSVRLPDTEQVTENLRALDFCSEIANSINRNAMLGNLPNPDTGIPIGLEAETAAENRLRHESGSVKEITLSLFVRI